MANNTSNPLILNSIPHFSMAKKVNELTDKGLEEKAKWVGLKKYMEDFSLLNEREVPDLKLWENTWYLQQPLELQTKY